jgi:SAM-dependent methyltransferase
MNDSMKFCPVGNNSPQHAVLRHLADIPSEERETTRVLDIPTGGGIIAFPLGFGGFNVVGCDLFSESAQALASAIGGNGDMKEAADCCRAALPRDVGESLVANSAPATMKVPSIIHGNMEEKLPFDDDAFDVAVSVEGIEHIESMEKLLKEFRRVLTKGGRLVITTPNMLCLRSRFAYSMTGQRTLKTFIDECMSVQARDEDRIYHGHVFLVDYFQLRYLLHNTGFRLKQVLPSRFSPTSLLLAPLMVPFVVLFTFLAARRWKRKFRKCNDKDIVSDGAQQPYDEICKHVLSPALLLTGSLIIEAEAL